MGDKSEPDAISFSRDFSRHARSKRGNIRFLKGGSVTNIAAKITHGSS